MKIINQYVFLRKKVTMFHSKLEFQAGQYIQLDFSTFTLGMDRIRLYVNSFPLDKNGNKMSILTTPNYKGFEVGGHSLFGINRLITIDGGSLGNIYKGYHWIITKPPQASINSNSAGFIINISYNPID